MKRSENYSAREVDPDSMNSIIDRIAPTRRPAGKNAGTQRWESLLFCHWEVPKDDLRNLVPGELELDLFDGRAFVGLVPFKMRAIRPAWLPRTFAFNFYETNVRTYVTYKGRPGVYFFSLDASSFLAVHAARLGWSLPYFHATMSHEDKANVTTYRCDRNRTTKSRVRFRVGSGIGTAAVGTLEHFLFERYLLFVKVRNKVYVGSVHHEPYQIFEAELLEIDDGLVNASGLTNLESVPELAHYSPGVDVEVFSIRPADDDPAARQGDSSLS